MSGRDTGDMRASNLPEIVLVNAEDMEETAGASVGAEAAGASGAAKAPDASALSGASGTLASSSVSTAAKSGVSPQAANLPSLGDLQAELSRVKGRRRRKRVLFGLLAALVVIAAVSLLLATRVFPVLNMHGQAMSPTLSEGEVVVAFSQATIEQGDVVAFYSGGDVLVRRVIAFGGDTVDIKDDGLMYVNGQPFDGSHAGDALKGSCTIALPYKVPAGCMFVMSDNCSAAVDSRNAEFGCISQDQVLGELMLRVWPLESIAVLA